MRRRKRMIEDLDRDIRDHIEREAEDNIARGMAPGEAHSAGLRKFGNVTRVREDTREVWNFVWIEQLLDDVRFGLRMLRKNPGVTAAAALTSVSITAQRIGGTLMAIFAGLALVLAGMGLSSVIACAVSDRTHEIGVRMALGARPREVCRLVVGQGMILALVGLLVGLPLALAMGRAISGLLYGVAPDDLATLAGVATILAGVSFAACRAMRVDPTVALRYE